MRKLLSLDEFFDMGANGRIEYLSTLTEREERELLESMDLAQLVRLELEFDKKLETVKEELRKLDAEDGA